MLLLLVIFGHQRPSVWLFVWSMKQLWLLGLSQTIFRSLMMHNIKGICCRLSILSSTGVCVCVCVWVCTNIHSSCQTWECQEVNLRGNLLTFRGLKIRCSILHDYLNTWLLFYGLGQEPSNIQLCTRGRTNQSQLDCSTFVAMAVLGVQFGPTCYRVSCRRPILATTCPGQPSAYLRAYVAEIKGGADQRWIN